jgi:hypothetical protein
MPRESHELTSSLPDALKIALLDEIDPGEKLRWCGQPLPKRAVARQVLGLLLMSMLFTGLGLLLSILTYQTWLELRGLVPIDSQRRSTPTIELVIAMGVISGFVTIGINVMVLLVLRHAADEARHTAYALTNSRVLRLTLSKKQRVVLDAVEPGHPLHLRRTDIGDGRGDIALDPRFGNQPARLTLIGVDKAREVERLIRATFDPPGMSKH